MIGRTRLWLLAMGSTLAVGCSDSDSDYMWPTTLVSAYPAHWYLFADSSFTTPGDSVLITISRYDVDSVPYPPGFSTTYWVDIKLTKRSPLSCVVFADDGKQWTRPIRDTLDTGTYALRVSEFKEQARLLRVKLTIAGEESNRAVFSQ